MKEIGQVGFFYTLNHIGADGRLISSETHHNLMPAAGVSYMINATFKGGSQYSTWYLSLFTANRTPSSVDTMTTFMADCVEDTVYTAVAGARQTITFPAEAAGVLTTVAAPNVFAFTGASTIRGAFVTTGSVRGANAGLLISEILFPSAKTLAAGESLSVPVGFALISA